MYELCKTHPEEERCNVLNVFLITAYLNYNNYKIQTIYLDINQCNCHSYNTATYYVLAWAV